MNLAEYLGELTLHFFEHLAKVHDLVDIVVLVVFLVPNILLRQLRSVKFLARCLYGTSAIGTRHIRATGKLLRYLPVVPNGFIRLRSARLIAELEILEPADPRPTRYDFRDNALFKQRETRWLADRKKAREKIATNLKLLIAGEEHSSDEALEPPGQTQPGFDFDISGGIDDRSAAIRRYFEVLRSLGKPDERFIAKVKIDNGFLAPMFLITGILSRYQDNWKRVIDNYQAQLEETKYSRELNELRSFQFNCWLLWGPSIPLCQCPPWQHASRDHKRSRIAYQYGYGDENNSIDLLLTDKADRELVKLAPFGHAAAAACSIEGRIKWGPQFGNGICPAQKAVRGDEGQPGAYEGGRIVIDLGERHDSSVAQNVQFPNENLDADIASQQQTGYYSAYIWLMLLIVDKDGKPFFPDQPWRNLLPFFEHGNIADASTYATLKALLVAKVLTAVHQIRAMDSSVRLALVCAFDRSLCGDPGGLKHKHVGDDLLTLFRRAIESDRDLQHDAALILPEPGANFGAYPMYAACHLPERVDEFYAKLPAADA